MSRPTHFIDGSPIPDGYLPKVEALIEEVCDIEEKFFDWELEQHLQKIGRNHGLPDTMGTPQSETVPERG